MPISSSYRKDMFQTVTKSYGLFSILEADDINGIKIPYDYETGVSH